ncbi:peptidase S28 family protein [Heterostelium album PN500]|uniref:Peptidase S28 family protein n=1 Tax=Heterostelium pallidum (strain ATCC 26659 / Pp 5 / PN500) TaxID=670386 RepID=D3BNB4_HETP5|nr:peptidase S28 family protein [Heterostelium album PN500]EFA76774.1 peptidase S28 family protein [Heterostelium album PN500]|eukprot:XP_020428906.1 peptidase S28 family protein [Heterostelium album PN500]
MKTVLFTTLLLVVALANASTFATEANVKWEYQWYNQTLNHFDAEDTRTFLQRYYVNDQYYDYKKGGPIILYINGEGPVSSPPNKPTDGTVIYAQALGALIVTLEHRYYGDSSPFADLSTENLKFLSSRQALNDLAIFILDYRSTIQNAGDIITIGGSYSGALSAWFRVKYPHVTVGSVASSGVVNAILDFTAFDEWVAYAAGEQCADALRLVTSTAEQQIFGGNAAAVKQLFQAETLTDDGDFFYWLADSMAEGIQYGYHDQLCTPLINAMNNKGDMLETYSNYTINVWGTTLGTPGEYATLFQQNTTHDINKADRQWWFQTCTEFGYFQNAPAQGSIRSQMVNMTYHRTHCANVFGKPLWPNTEATNDYYGGNHTAGTNIVFTNVSRKLEIRENNQSPIGSQDPWSRASITVQEYPTEPSLMVTCNNCGHCVDLRECPGGCSTPNNLDQVRQQTLKIIETWL